jgi:hypothetical protein
MDQAPGLPVLCYLTGRIASPVGANVITITIFRQDPSLGHLARTTSSWELDSLEDQDISGGVWTNIAGAKRYN